MNIILLFLSVLWMECSLSHSSQVPDDEYIKKSTRVTIKRGYFSEDLNLWISSVTGALAGGSAPLCLMNSDPQSVASCLVVSSFLSLSSSYFLSRHLKNSAEDQYDREVKIAGVEKADSVYCKKYLASAGITSIFTAIFAGAIYSAVPK